MPDAKLSALTSATPVLSDLWYFVDVSDTTDGPAGSSRKAPLSTLETLFGATFQPLDAELTALAGLTSAADKLPYFTGSGTAAVTTFTAAGRALVDDADAAAQRTTLGLGTAATQSTSAFAAASHTHAQSDVTGLTVALALLAPLASPAFTGTPTAPTATGGTNTTQIATTAFVSAAVAAAVSGLLELKGSLDCSANPNYPAADKGDAYYVSAAGKVGGASGKSVDVGDTVIASADNAGGPEASVGTSWFVLEHNLAGALLSANNLSDLANAATARTNLGVPAGSGTSSGTNTGDQFGSTTAGALIGRRSGSAGAAEEISVGTGLSLSGTTLTATGGGLTVGTTTITSGTTTRVLYDNAGTLGEYTVTGTAGSVVLSASPTLTGTVAAAAATFSGVVGLSAGSIVAPALYFSTDSASWGLARLRANCIDWVDGSASYIRFSPAQVGLSGSTAIGWLSTGGGFGSGAAAYSLGLSQQGGAGSRILEITNPAGGTSGALVCGQPTTSTLGHTVKGIASRTAALVEYQTSAGASLGHPGGTIFADYANGASTSTGGTFDDLYTHTTVANTFANNGDTIRGRIGFKLVGHATATRQIKLVFAGTAIFDTTALTNAANANGVIDYAIVRVSATVVRYAITIDCPGLSAAVPPAVDELTGLTLTGTNILKLTGAAAAAGAAGGDITAKLQWVDRGEQP